MADFGVAFSWMMENEDPQYKFAEVPDVGGYAISGINSHSWPAEFAGIATLPQATRGPAVTNFYRSHFWNSWFDRLTSNNLAKRVFDAAVNMGSGTAVDLLQQALGAPLAVDGAWGPETLAAANRADPDALVLGFINARVIHYQKIGGPYLDQWVARAKK
jgi:lysozyme family protein